MASGEVSLTEMENLVLSDSFLSFVNTLMASLDLEHGRFLKLEAAWIISIVSNISEESSLSILSGPLRPLFEDLLKSNDLLVLEFAVMIVGNLAVEGAEFKHVLLQELSIVPRLFEINQHICRMDTSLPRTIVESVLWAIEHLTKNAKIFSGREEEVGSLV
mmetsp:Transcript_12878/g.19958  ORF Transcript_12878/g.19958 Transcript_12878/m.19958 type:complete len:161 (+) Transcript_12878:302-784(+)